MKRYSSQDKKITEDLYHYFLQHGEDDGWGEKDKYGNFQLLTKISEFTKQPIEGSSILDVGCGTGDFVAFLRGHTIEDYLGVDIVKLSIQLAKLKYPKEKFRSGDFLKLKIDKQYDFVFSSGAMSAILKTDNYALMESFIIKMWEHARLGVAFNFLVKRFSQEDDDTLFLYDIDQVRALCKKNVPQAHCEYTLNRAGDNLEFLQAHVYLYR